MQVCPSLLEIKATQKSLKLAMDTSWRDLLNKKRGDFEGYLFLFIATNLAVRWYIYFRVEKSPKNASSIDVD